MSPAADLDIEYIQNADTMYVIRKDADMKSVANFEPRAGFVFRMDMKEKRVVGFIIHHVSVKHSSLLRFSKFEQMERFSEDIEMLNDFLNVGKTMEKA